MNHLVFLDARAGELEKILSGVKSMIVKELDPAQPVVQPVNPGDSLFFLRNTGECEVRVKATVVGVHVIANYPVENLSHSLKEMQPRLQFTEDQYNHWSEKSQILLIEFVSAQKMDTIHVAPGKVMHRSDWIAFDEFHSLMS